MPEHRTGRRGEQERFRRSAQVLEVTLEVATERSGERNASGRVGLRDAEHLPTRDLGHRLGDVQSPPDDVDRATTERDGLAEAKTERPEDPHE